MQELKNLCQKRDATEAAEAIAEGSGGALEDEKQECAMLLPPVEEEQEREGEEDDAQGETTCECGFLFCCIACLVAVLRVCRKTCGGSVTMT